MTEVIVTGAGDGDQVDLGEEAERDAFVAAGAAAAHEATAENHAVTATDAALGAAAAAETSTAAAEVATESATSAATAATDIGTLIAAHTEAMREQTAAMTGLLAEIQASRTPAAPPQPAEPPKKKADKEPRSGRRRFADAYYGRR